MRTAIVTAVMAAIVAVILFLGAGDDGGPNAFIVIGVTNGATYGLIALGLVLVYKGTRVFNFAAGEFGTIAAFIVFVLINQVRSVEIPYAVAVLVAILGATILGLIMERVVARPLLNAPRVTLLVATIAFTLLAITVEQILFLPEAKSLDPMIRPTDAAGNPIGMEIFDYFIEPQRLVVMGLLGGLAILLGYFFSRTDLGLAVLATSQDSFATRVVGVGVERMSRFIWGSAALLGAIAGILYIPILGVLFPGAMTVSVLIPAFTGAVIGGMTSLPGAFVGGTLVGVVQGLASWAGNHYRVGDDFIGNTIPGFSDVALFATLLIVLLARPQGLLGREA